MIFINTSIAIPLRDLEPQALARLRDAASKPVLSMITWIELTNGAAKGDDARRRRLARLVQTLPVELFTWGDLRARSQIVDRHGDGSRRTLDWMIAAQALARGAALATRNPRNVGMIGDLKLELW